MFHVLSGAQIFKGGIKLFCSAIIILSCFIQPLAKPTFLQSGLRVLKALHFRTPPVYMNVVRNGTVVDSN